MIKIKNKHCPFYRHPLNKHVIVIEVDVGSGLYLQAFLTAPLTHCCGGPVVRVEIQLRGLGVQHQRVRGLHLLEEGVGAAGSEDIGQGAGDIRG
jgi:hypothetical protein